MKSAKFFISLLIALGLSGGETYAQADKYEKYDNSKTVKSTEGQMDFYLVFKSHFDIGYSALARDVVMEYRTEMIDKAMDVIDCNLQQMKDKNLQFTWTVPGWPLKQMLWDRQDPARKLRIEKALKNGNLVTHGLAYTTHTESLEIEDLVRSMGYSTSLSKQYGLSLPTDAKMTDVPGHTWFLPTMLHHAGINFMDIGANITNRTSQVPYLFWWEGPDGSKVLTFFHLGYSGGLFPPEGWKHKAWLAFVHAGDNQGPPTANEVNDVIKNIKKKYPNAKIHIGKMSDFADALLATHPDLPTVRGDMSDSWIHGVMSNPQSTAKARRIRPLTPALETLHTQSREWGIIPYEISDDLAEIYDQSLRYGEHTWGLANQHFVPGMVGDKWHQMYHEGLDLPYSRMVQSWEEHQGFVTNMENKIRPELEYELYTLADNVGVDGFRFVVYNPLPWERSGVVTFVMPTQGNIRQAYVKEYGTDHIYPLQTYGSETRRSGHFYAENIPANGYKTYVLTDQEPARNVRTLKSDFENKSIENKWFKVTFNEEKGCIQSIWDKVNKKELVDASSADGFGSYVYERYSKEQCYRYCKEYLYDRFKGSHYPITCKSVYLDENSQPVHTSPKNMHFAVEDHKVALKAFLVPDKSLGEEKHTAGLVVTLYEDVPYIDLKLAIVNKPATEEAEAGWISLPFNIKNPQFRIGRIGSVVDPAKDIIAGSQFNYILANTGLTIHQGSYSIGVCPLDAPAVSLGNLDFMRYVPTFQPCKSHLYFNLFNNRWNTNFTSFWNGNLNTEVRIWVNPKQANDEIGLITPSWEARLPLQVGFARTAGGKLPATKQGVKVSRKGILVTAYGKNPDGEGKLIRLWETAGQSGPCEVSLPTAKSGMAQPVNLRGIPLGTPLPVEQGKLKININKFSPASYIIY